MKLSTRLALHLAWKWLRDRTKGGWRIHLRIYTTVQQQCCEEMHRNIRISAGVHNVYTTHVNSRDPYQDLQLGRAHKRLGERIHRVWLVDLQYTLSVSGNSTGVQACKPFSLQARALDLHVFTRTQEPLTHLALPFMHAWVPLRRPVWQVVLQYMHAQRQRMQRAHACAPFSLRAGVRD